MRKYFLYAYISAMALTICMFAALIIAGRVKAGKPAPPAEPFYAADAEGEPASAPVFPVNAGISAGTTMVYEYYYLGDGFIETAEEKAPYFLINKTRDYLENVFMDWEVLGFGESKVVMRKSIAGDSGQRYTLGIYEGYVAVFYDDEINGTSLKEITDTPVSALSPEERERLAKGLKIRGRDNLIRALEDFGS